MTTYYVDALAGSDGNSGTSTSTPWRSVAKVVAASLVAGDSVLFQRGQYWSGTQLTIGWSGAAGNPIVFGAYGSGPRPILSAGDWNIGYLPGGSNFAKNTIHNLAHSYLTFQDLDVRNGYSANFYNDAAVLGIPGPGQYTFFPIVGVSILNCVTSGAGNDNILVIHGCDEIVIRGTESHHANDYLQIYGGASQVATGIEIADGGTNVLIEDCWVHDCPTGISIHCHPIGTPGTALGNSAPNGFSLPQVTIRRTPVSNCGLVATNQFTGHVFSTTSNGISIANGLNAVNPNTGLANPLYGNGAITIDQCPVLNTIVGSGIAFGRDISTADNASGVFTIARCLLANNAAFALDGGTVDGLQVEYCQLVGSGARVRNANGTKLYQLSLYLAAGGTLLTVDSSATFGGTTSDLTVRNCLFGSGDGSSTAVKITQAAVTAGMSAPVLDHNIYQSSGSRWFYNNDAGGKSFATWQGLGFDASGSSAATDPGYANVAAGILSLVSTSPALGAGARISGVNDQYARVDSGGLQRIVSPMAAAFRN